MSMELEEYNAKELTAWNEWKTICSILGCSRENSSLLAKVVKKSFIRKINEFSFGKINEQTLKGTINDSDSTFLSLEEEIAMEFDLSIIEKRELDTIDKNGETIRSRIFNNKQKIEAKNYKDFIWNLIEKSNDPALRIIRGKLTGKLSIMNYIVERFISKNFSGKLVTYQKENKKKRAFILDDSLQKTVDYDTINTLESFVEDLVTAEKFTEIDKQYLTKVIADLFNYREAVILLAKLHKIAFTEECIYEAIQTKKSTVSEIYNNKVVPKLKNLPKDCMLLLEDSPRKTTSFLISLLIKQIESEKNIKSLLLEIRKKEITI